MAQMIPDAVPDGRSKGEQRLFARLQSLPDDCLVYDEPPVGDRYPGFVVIIPTPASWSSRQKAGCLVKFSVGIRITSPCS